MASDSAAASFSKPITGIVYVNTAPPPTARVVGDLQEDIALRYSVPLTNITVTDADAKPVDPTLELAEAPRIMMVEILQANGDRTMYKTELVMRCGGFRH